MLSPMDASRWRELHGLAALTRVAEIDDRVAGFVMVSDTADLRFRGPKSQFNEHGGYNRVFGDLPKTSTGKIQKFVLRERVGNA